MNRMSLSRLHRRMTADAAPAFRARRSALARFVSAYGQEMVIACAIVALFVVVSAINPRFLGTNNLNTIVSGNAYIAVAAIGMSMIIVTGHIDVSVGALIGVLATISGTIAVSGYPVWFAWIAPIFVGAEFPVTRVELWLDSRPLYVGSENSVTLDLSGVEPGEYVLLARVFDHRGAQFERARRVSIGGTAR